MQLPPTILSKGDPGKTTNSKPASGGPSRKATTTDAVAKSNGVDENGESAEEPSEDGDGALDKIDDDEPPVDKLDGIKLKDRPSLRPPRTLETTLFDRLERLYGNGIKRVLTTQYR